MEQLSAIHLTTLDYFAIGILVISAAVGVWRGLFREVIALASWFIAAWLSYHYCDYLASEWLSAFKILALTRITWPLASVSNPVHSAT